MSLAKGRQIVCEDADYIADAVNRLHLRGDVKDAMAKLISIINGDKGVAAAVACGPRALPALRAVLWARELGNLYETRRRAVTALAHLRDYQSLVEFLESPPNRPDALEKIAQEALMNACARALAASDESRLVPLLLDTLRRRPLIGAIETLGQLNRPEAIPYFIDALAEDSSRPAAEAALRRLRQDSTMALRDAALLQVPSARDESMSSRRRRLAALRLLAECASPSSEPWPPLQELVNDSAPRIATAACALCLVNADALNATSAIVRLIELLGSADWPVSSDIQHCLARHIDRARPFIEQCLAQKIADPSHYSPESRRRRVLLEILHEEGRDA